MSGAKQRVDLWLWRARFTKTRAAASQLTAEGGVRLIRDGAGRRLDKASASLMEGDVLVFSWRGGLRAIRVEKLAPRRGAPHEAIGLYAELGEDLMHRLT